MDIISVKQRFGIIGNNEALNRALDVALRVASTDLSVLITGESGVGKEFFPQIIHANSPRKHGNYIAVNCGAIPEGTIDSELFGHEKGSFTGASESRKGYFEVADGGTIFLDEVAELPLTTQVRLLRILQTGEFIRVGSSKSQKTNVRVVAATNINLHDAIAKGRFREDLYYRLNTVPIIVPPLRERKEDIYLLFRRFASDIATQYRMPAITIDDNARSVLENYTWPGNIRQLKNVAEQISAVEESRVITSEILMKYLPNYQGSSLPIISAERRGSGVDASEIRDILYTALYDLKGDMQELKRMVSELVKDRSTGGTYDSRRSEIAGLLPTNFGRADVAAPTVTSAHIPALADNEALFADSEEVSEDLNLESMTDKQKAQREAIIKALRKHLGKRKEAAKELFISERTLYRKIKELDINEF